jgi:hypothetical protein
MPVKSAAQFRLMEMAANGGSGRMKAGSPSRQVAQEFLNKTPEKVKSQFAKMKRPSK